MNNAINAIVNFAKTNHVAVGSILVLCGVGVAGSYSATQQWTAAHVGAVTALTAIAGVIGALWKTKYGSK